MAKKSVFDEPANGGNEMKKKQPKHAGQGWSDDDEQMLVILHESGWTYKEIAKDLKRSELAIKARLSKLGIIQFDIQKALEKYKN